MGHGEDPKHARVIPKDDAAARGLDPLHLVGAVGLVVGGERLGVHSRLFLEAATALAPTPTAPSVRMGTGASNSETGTRDHGAPLLEVLAVGDKRVNSVARRHRLELRWLGCTASAAAEDEAAKRVCPVARVPACLSHGATSVIGWRREMEDAVAIAAPFLPATTVAEVKGKSCTENGGGKLKDREKGFFVVFDGHGGLRVAEACRERMHMVLAEDVDRLWAGDYKDDQRRAVEGGHGSLLRACGRRGRRHRRV
jgi:hypothetical protein